MAPLLQETIASGTIVMLPPNALIGVVQGIRIEWLPGAFRKIESDERQFWCYQNWPDPPNADKQRSAPDLDRKRKTSKLSYGHGF